MSSMTSRSRLAPSPSERALSTEPDTARAWWFLGTLAVLRNPDGAARPPTIIELTIPSGGSPPCHIHDTLDDSFLLLEGEVFIRCGNRSFVARANSYVVLPAGVEHTFRVISATPARMLLVHASDEFLDFIQAVGTPTRELRLPDPGSNHVSREALVRIAAQHDLRIVGSPVGEDEICAFQAT